MNEQIRNQYVPDTVSPPGETLEEVLVERGMSQAELAERTGRPKKTINEIVKGKAAITPETALQFERVLGIPAGFWIAREQYYRESLARAKETLEFEKQADWLDQVPYRAMVKLGWIPEHREKARQLEEVLRFFAVASPSSWHGVWGAASPAFRRSSAFESEPGAVAAWLRKGELEAGYQELAEYDVDAFRRALERVRSLTRQLPNNFASIVTQQCNEAGVCVAFVPELPGTRAWGATRWLTPTRPLMQLSLRYKTDDHLWFTFFHEAGHIILHGRRDVFLEADERGQSEKESEADAFAQEWLIPETRYRVFRRLGAFTCAAVSRFAFELGIAPGIVVGRLQHDGHLERTQCNNLKKKVDWALELL
ncbi:MAG: HigA family addiction module antitoxin [Bryobacteraceae bacterium]|jgi:addiction module HigA family antidote